MTFNGGRSVRMLCGIALLLLLPVVAMAQELNLIDQTLNGQPFCGATVDEMTDEFGRPTAVSSNAVISDVVGPIVDYHNLGLSLMFASSSDDPDQGLTDLVVSLTRRFDEPDGLFYEAFPGALNPPLGEDMKLDAVQTVFNDLGYATSLTTPDEGREALSNLPFATNAPVWWRLSVSIDATNVDFLHEEVTKFLERILISCVTESTE